MTEETRDERELKAVLGRASRPAAPAGAVDRLLAMLPARAGSVIAFRPRQRLSPYAAWPAVAALAASFAFGIYLGFMGAGDEIWNGDASEESVIGLGEAGDFLDGDPT